MQDLNLDGDMNVSIRWSITNVKKILKKNRFYVFCFMFSLDKHALL